MKGVKVQSILICTLHNGMDYSDPYMASGFSLTRIIYDWIIQNINIYGEID